MCRKYFRSLLFRVSTLLIIGSVSFSISAATIVRGSDYFNSTGARLDGNKLVTRPNGLDEIRPQYAPLPNVVDTIVERQLDKDGQDCNLAVGGNCKINIELVGLSLQTEDKNMWIREDLNVASRGDMTISLDSIADNIASGTFDSTFEVNFEYSFDQGANWFNMDQDFEVDGEIVYTGIDPYSLKTTNSIWSSEPDKIILKGEHVNQDANFHTNLVTDQFDFFAPESAHTLPASDASIHNTILIGAAPYAGAGPFSPGVVHTPIPGAVWLFGTGLVALFGFNQKKKHKHFRG